ncbi:MAG: ribose 5-phosphate isomerase B [Odoribacter sp.]|nr:ribose 5-phosphate isomerase B [Odoribacter sp.]
MKIVIGCDHAGYEYKVRLVDFLRKKGFEVDDFGTNSLESTDYPDVAHPLAEAVEQGKFDKGFLLCGTGNGMAMAANKHQGIRCGLCWNVEIAALTRRHNDANVCAIPARFLSYEEAENIVTVFLSAGFEGDRHCIRIEKIPV